MRIYCTYCWQGHESLSIIEWIKHGCGTDEWRYFTDKDKYLQYIKQYTSNGKQHIPLGKKALIQLKLL